MRASSIQKSSLQSGQRTNGVEIPNAQPERNPSDQTIDPRSLKEASWHCNRQAAHAGQAITEGRANRVTIEAQLSVLRVEGGLKVADQHFF